MTEFNETVLCIDDEKIILYTIRDYLEDSNYEVHTANSGEEGLRLFREIQPDVVLVDLNMPGIMGTEVLARVREESPETVVIVVSGTGDIKMVIEALRLGAWDFITKPIEDMALLEHAIKKSLERSRLIKENIENKNNLKKRSEELENSLSQLKQAQDQLIQSEKMAALGSLVAGIAHEINTPVGVGVTAASHLERKTIDFERMLNTGELSEKQLKSYLGTAKESSILILRNLMRAAELIQSFKMVAVDQSSGDKRKFQLHDYIHEILLNLHPKLKRHKHIINIECDPTLELYSYPGAFSQILTNFILNSVIHGYDENTAGNILIKAEENGQGTIQLVFKDDGKGIPDEMIQKVFDPFFTTKMGQGGSGLGLHIVYNLVNTTLKGNITCKSTPGEGTTFLIETPQDLKD